MNVLIVDDNEIARDILMQLTTLVDTISVVNQCASAMDAFNSIQKDDIDVIFLDIEMPEMTGLELTKQLQHTKPIIIFTTSKPEYAIEAFELNVADYIVKPVTPARFLQAVNKAKELINSRTSQIEVAQDAFIFIRDSNIVKRLELDEILYIEAMGDYVKLHTEKKFFAIHSTLKAIEARLPVSKFIKVHRSYIVAVAKIDSLQDRVLVVKGKTIPIADTFRAVLNKRLNVL